MIKLDLEVKLQNALKISVETKANEKSNTIELDQSNLDQIIGELKHYNSIEVKNEEPKTELTENVSKYRDKMFRVNQNGIYADITLRPKDKFKVENAYVISDNKKLIFRVRDFKFIRQVKKDAIVILKNVLNTK